MAVDRIFGQKLLVLDTKLKGLHAKIDRALSYTPQSKVQNLAVLFPMHFWGINILNKMTIIHNNVAINY